MIFTIIIESDYLMSVPSFQNDRHAPQSLVSRLLSELESDRSLTARKQEELELIKDCAGVMYFAASDSV